jgi:hypothetical protein
MKQIGIELNEGASLHDAIIDCARSIAEGYGAGTLTTPGKDDDYEEHDYLGFWTSKPNERATKFALIIEIPEDLQGNDYLVAGVVLRKADEYKS